MVGHRGSNTGHSTDTLTPDSDMYTGQKSVVHTPGNNTACPASGLGGRGALRVDQRSEGSQVPVIEV